jgi:prepilin-type N-terminal cleavage/methylation domain-containing protein
MRAAFTSPSPARRGFTLIELLTVIGILGVLATLTASGLANARVRSQQAVCLGNLHQVAVAVEIYSDDTGKRPRSVTRLTTKPSWLKNPKSLLCPADPVTTSRTSSGTTTNQAWGNIANASQEPWSAHDLRDPESGSWQAEIQEKEEHVSFSYLHPLGWPKSAWQRLAGLGNQVGTAVCQLHGVRMPPGNATPEQRTYMAFEGRTFRAQRDGAVVRRKIFRSQPGAASQATTTALPRAPDFPWEFYTDAPLVAR